MIVLPRPRRRNETCQQPAQEGRKEPPLESGGLMDEFFCHKTNWIERHGLLHKKGLLDQTAGNLGTATANGAG